MADQQSDAMKATNDALTSPDHDLQVKDSDYPAGTPRERVQVDSGGTLASPGAERPGTTDTGAGARVARGATGPGLGGELEANPNTAHANLSVPTGPRGTGAPQPGSSNTPATADPNCPTNH